MTPQPTKRSDRIICEGVRSYATPRRERLPNFAEQFGYPSIAVLSTDPGTDVTGHFGDQYAVAKKALFDHLIGTREKRWRQIQAELLGRPLVHDQLKLSWSLHGQFGRTGTSQDPIHVRCRAGVQFVDIWSVRDETASSGEEP